MKILGPVTVALAASVLMLSSHLLAKDTATGQSGEQLFQEHCAACHPNGGNILSPQKTLSRKDREANGIKTAEDIVRKMRNPGPFPTHPQEWAGMRMFDEKTIANDDALKIADYILKTFP
jgi:mono/diheme cytochrome c family protein